ncbi:hypothetical protein CAPTEDRAFT_184728 [Capitella teleta]|uniref:RRM domain-containing protein n=1 Tax=Capitella teleta TaxID=283909 RepID=R7TR55_CAPTE|nr:hypothetical protein CAPTEDRAFT_184728 [Capitella teleta]|eukprot:ELT96378.1 hypothetical protein CAPTEDRAFT_184728 [Capitella teleta]
MLIPPQDRKKKLNLWREVVKFIDANESRIRAEEQCIEDEEFIVWRWLQNTANGRKRKVWQGQAFGAKESSNMPAFRPTKCLKIRNMFDAEVEYGEDWHVHIQDAILEKCGPDHSIVHMAVDKSSKEGCVFVMCASSEASGRAFHALHGWWFDGILITVKFLRLERYYERFPDAIGCTQPLIPSNSEGNSLSVPFHQSITESS